MTNKEYIIEYIKGCKTGTPIYTVDIAEKMAEDNKTNTNKAAAAVSVAMKRIIEQGIYPNLKVYQKGIYYLSEETPFGATGINKEQLIKRKYLSADNGYETGYTALYRFGLTTQIPVERVLVTNRARDGQRLDKSLGVYIRPPKVKVTAENKGYLQMLDVMELMVKAPVDNSNPYILLANILKQYKLKYGVLLAMAEKYYSKNAILQIARTAAATGGIEE